MGVVPVLAVSKRNQEGELNAWPGEERSSRWWAFVEVLVCTKYVWEGGRSLTSAGRGRGRAEMWFFLKARLLGLW